MKNKNYIPYKYIPCIDCGKKASWKYMPGYENFCEECVPRGCSCTRELKDGIDDLSEEASSPESYIEKLDDKGRRIPCCEFWSIREEEHFEKEYIDRGWEYYFKDHQDELDYFKGTTDDK